MSDLAEYALTGFPPPPRWLARLSLADQLWHNPVFQRCYRRGGRIYHVRPLWGLCLGLFLSTIAIISLSGYTTGALELFSIAWTVTFILPGGLVLLFAGLRLVDAGLTRSVIQINSDFSGGKGESVLSSPMSDEEIYYGISLALLVKRLVASEGVIGWLAGLAVPNVIAFTACLISNRLTDSVLPPLAVMGWTLFAMFLFAIYVTLFAFMAAFVSTRYALVMSVSAAQASGLAHIVFISFFVGPVIVLFLNLTVMVFQAVVLPWSLLFALLVQGVSASVAFCVTVWMGQSGVDSVTRLRRPGVYGRSQSDATTVALVEPE